MAVEKLKVNDFSFYLEDIEVGKGKVIVTADYDENYSYYWGSMGSDLKSFLKRIDEDYFVCKMIPRDEQQIFSKKITGRNIRKIWREEIMPWYKYLEFQKHFREKLKDFLIDIQDSNHFIYEFDWFIKSLDYHLIECNYERKEVENTIEDILQSECWHLIETEISPKYKRLKLSFTELKKII